MVEENNSKIGMAITALLLSLGLGGNFLLADPSALDDWYICTTSLETGEFSRLSGTLYTGYPNELDNSGYVRCKDTLGNKGTWVDIVAYAEAVGIDIGTLVPADNELDSPIGEEISPPFISESPTQRIVTCTSGGCI